MSIESKIAENLSSNGHATTENIPFLAAYGRWAEMAQRELDKRAALVLEGMTFEQLQAIAKDQASIPEIVKAMQESAE